MGGGMLDILVVEGSLVEGADGHGGWWVKDSWCGGTHASRHREWWVKDSWWTVLPEDCRRKDALTGKKN